MFSFLARIILFAIAVSVIRSVVTAVQRAFMSGRTMTPGVRTPPGPRQNPAQQGPTMLQQDPVCGTYVAVDASLKRVVNGRVVHFCSPECRDKYKG